jgi:hypothetical protein
MSMSAPALTRGRTQMLVRVTLGLWRSIGCATWQYRGAPPLAIIRTRWCLPLRRLTLPSRGCPKGCAFCAPLMSNVRRQMPLKPSATAVGTKKTWRDVLVLGTTKKNQGTIRRHYLLWRAEQRIQVRCDNSVCQFHSAPLAWNGDSLPLILDHREGNRYDNTPGNLRLLCPNCDSQLTTRGGANRGRVSDLVPGGYTLNNRDGTRIIARSGVAQGSSTASAIGIATVSEPELDA